MDREIVLLLAYAALAVVAVALTIIAVAGLVRHK